MFGCLYPADVAAAFLLQPFLYSDCTVGTSPRLRYPLIKEYTLNRTRVPIIIYGEFLN